MNLIDRVIEFNDWPTNKKSALLMAIALMFHVSLLPFSYFMGKAGDLANGDMVLLGELAGILIVSLCLALSLLSMRTQVDGRWTVYLVVSLYGGWVGMMLFGYGVWATSYMAWLPGVLILVTLWYDVTIGLVSFFYALAMLLVLSILTAYDVIPYAPMLVNRSVDAYSSGIWAASKLATAGGLIIFSFSLCLMAVLTRNRQSDRLASAQAMIRKYAPSQVAEKIFAGEHVADFRPERVKLTVFFSDVEGFTKASDHLEPEELAQVLNQYLSEMADIARKYGATINQFVGDGIMLFFGAPNATTDADHAVRAVSMALEMQERILELNDLWIKLGIRSPFRARIGINTGYASVGDFGSDERKTYTAIGMQTNIAARIQAKCEPGKVLITDTTRALVNDQFDCEEKGELDLKGVHYPVKVYEVTGQSGNKPGSSQ